MRYSFGDSSESPFDSNFLELLRDALDFAVYVLQADQRILSTREHADARRRRADAELAELEALRRAVSTTIESTARQSADSPLAECAAKMVAVCDGTVLSSAASLQQRLAQEVMRAEAEEKSERDGCGNAFLALLAHHVPPESSSVVRLHLLDAGSYEARREGVWPGIDVTYRCELAVPNGHPFAHVLRVENLRHRLEIGAPEQAGWIKKEVKVRPQHLERHVISEAMAEGSKITLCLRLEPGRKVGFDIETDIESGTVTATRVVGDQDHALAGPFDVQDEDVPKLTELCQTVHASLAELKTIRLVDAKFGDVDFAALPKFREIVERLISYLSPFVREIAVHSLEPDELVLRYPLANDRREEIFVSKTTLRQKYEQLPADLAGLFNSLGLNVPLSRSLPPVAHAERHEPVTRSELPPSVPPPPPLAAPPLPALPIFDAPASDPPPARAPDPVAAPPPPVIAALEPPASSGPSPDSRAQSERELVPTLQKIIELSKAGRQDDAFRECASLLERARFATYDLGDQRKALKVLLLLTGPATPPYVMRRAYRAGRDRARALSQQFKDPLDYESLGLCQAALGEPAAGETFREGLELERSRDPQSELCARLTMHVSRAGAKAAS